MVTLTCTNDCRCWTVGIYIPFQETKLVGYLLYSAYSTVASIQLYSSAEHQQ